MHLFEEGVVESLDDDGEDFLSCAWAAVESSVATAAAAIANLIIRMFLPPC
jgi:hypothetical protein